MVFWYGKHDVSKSFKRNYIICFLGCSYNYWLVHFLSLVYPMWDYDTWTVCRHHHILLFSDLWKYFLIISIYNWICIGKHEPRRPTTYCERFQLNWNYLIWEIMFAVTLHILLIQQFLGVIMCKKLKMSFTIAMQKIILRPYFKK